MSHQISLDLKQGEALRDAGMARAVDHADRSFEDWSVSALEYVRTFPEREFMTEDVRAYAYEQGLARPPHERAWGAVMVSARTRGIIQFSRYSLVKNKAAHRTPAAVWRKAI